MSIGLDLVTAVLMHFPHFPTRQCIIDRREIIANAIEESIREFPELDPEVLVAIGFSETHLGCDANEGGNWGAPISPTRRNVAGTPLQAARILWHSYQACGTWEAAARRFRTGLCNPTPVGSSYAHRVMHLTHVLEQNVAQINEQRHSGVPNFEHAILP